MKIVARKRSPDPQQEQLRQSKDEFNILVKQFISMMIAFKRGINGRGDTTFSLPVSNIKDPLPNEVISFLSELSSTYQAVAQQAAHIIQEQATYSQNRRQPGAQHPSIGQPGKVATASRSAKIVLGKNIFDTELATTPEEKERGLMFVKEPKIMTFTSTHPSVQKMWMRNTFIPLDIVFSRKGNIINICHGEPHSTRLIGDDQLSDLVVELPHGYCDKYGISVGHSVNLIF